MDRLIERLRADFPALTFAAGGRLQWSPRTATVTYNASDPTALYGILHELGHAQLGHRDYASDVELLLQEVAAWQAARTLSQLYDARIDDAYMEGCLDSYREWLYSRSACPGCGSHGLECGRNRYLCINCSTSWNVGDDRSCRTYRTGVVTGQ